MDDLLSFYFPSKDNPSSKKKTGIFYNIWKYSSPINFILGSGFEKFTDYLVKEKNRKIKAILNIYSNKYSETQLQELFVTNKKEFNSLYKLASNEFFREYIKEQTEHKKAQEIIVRLQTEIENLKSILKKLNQNAEKHSEEIEYLKQEINGYEEILANYVS